MNNYPKSYELRRKMREACASAEQTLGPTVIRYGQRAGYTYELSRGRLPCGRAFHSVVVLEKPKLSKTFFGVLEDADLYIARDFS